MRKEVAYRDLAHLTAAKIIESVYEDNRVGEFVDEDWPDAIVESIEIELKKIIDYHMEKSTTTRANLEA